MNVGSEQYNVKKQYHVILLLYDWYSQGNALYNIEILITNHKIE